MSSSSIENGSITFLTKAKKPNRSRFGVKFRDERRRRRRNRKRARNRIRLENKREERRKWHDDPLVKLIKILNERKIDEANLRLSENPLNLSSTTNRVTIGTSHNILDSTNASSFSSSPSLFSQLITIEPRIPIQPEQISRYDDDPREQPGDVEREFSRQIEREYTKEAEADRRNAKIAKSEKQDEEESPRFDERYVQVAKQSEAFDPERMLGYSRTDEDLPILDMENEVLQRNIKDYNTYVSSSHDKTKQFANNQVIYIYFFFFLNTEYKRLNVKLKIICEMFQKKFDRKNYNTKDSSTSFLEEENSIDPKGDLTCINGTFVPAPYVQHAVIKYVK